jgi:Carbohydrate binding domain
MTRSRDTANTQENVGGAVAPFVAGKNKIINGDMNIWQRGTSFTATGYTADRWLVDADTTSFSQSRQSFTAGTAPVAGYEGTYFMRTTRGTGGSYCNSQQRIEDVRTFAGQTVTLSFWAKASASCTIEPYYIQSFGSGGSGAVSGSFGTTTTLTTSWVRYFYTVAIPSVSGKTIGTGSYLNILVARITSSTNVDVDTWGVQVEAGSVATPFTTATGTLQGELAACQRYCIMYTADGAYNRYGGGLNYSTTKCNANISLPVEMRTTPSLTTTGTAANYAVNHSADTVTACSAVPAINGAGNSKKVASVDATVASGLTAGGFGVLISANNTTSFLLFTAEL